MINTNAQTAARKRRQLLRQRLTYGMLDDATRAGYTAELAELESAAAQTAAATIETYLPVFPGFYGTIFGDESGERERQELEYLFGDLPHAAELADFCLMETRLYAVDYRDYESEYARRMTDSVSAALESIPELKGFQELKFQELRSPREYNFYNDSGDVELVLSDERLFRASLLRLIRANKADFAAHLKSHYTSRSGFISHYSPDASDWINDIRSGIDALDGHKAGRLLDWILELNDYTEESLYYDTEAPSLSEYMTGPLIDLLTRNRPADMPETVTEILSAIDAGNKQFTAYRDAMLDAAGDRPERRAAATESILHQHQGLEANQTKLYAEAIQALIDYVNQ